jgi:molybdopterin synthase sulfur carrier subunit
MIVPTVFVPVPMRKLTNGETQVRVPGATLREMITNLDARYPGFAEYVTQEGRLKPGMAAIVNGEATTEGLRTKLADDAEVHFLPAISGG